MLDLFGICYEVGMAYRLIFADIRYLHSADIRYRYFIPTTKHFGYPPKILCHGVKSYVGTQTCLWHIYRTGVTWRDQNLGRKVEVIYMDEPCNAC